MKKLLIITVFVLMIAAFSLAVFFPYLSPTANKDYPYEGDEPDLPGFLDKAKSEFTKEEFMLRRSEYIGLKRGIDEDKPLPDPKLRQRAVAKLDRQQEKIFALPESDSRESLLAAWTPIGPAPIPNGQTSGVSTPVSGRTTAIAVHPTNPDIVYVGTAQGGLYRTTDGGANWTPLLDNALSLAIGAVAIAPSNPEIVYVGTGEANFSADSFFGVGIYRIDNASSAAPTVAGPLNRNAANEDVFSGNAVSEILVDPTNADTIFAGTATGIAGIGGFSTTAPTAPQLGIFRSTNAASAAPTFSKIIVYPVSNPSFPRQGLVYDMVMEPGNPNRIICAVLTDRGSIADGVYFTTDALAANPTFTRALISGSFSSIEGRLEFAVNKVGGILTVFAASSNFNGSVYRSTDGGANFQRIVINQFCNPQCFYDIAIDVDPTNVNRVYLGGSPNLTFGISTNGGTSFTESRNGLHVDSHAIAVAPSLPSTIYFGSDGGIYKSIDSGANWLPLNNATFSATQFQSVAVHPIDPNFTIGGTQDNGTNLRDSTGTWRRADFGDGGNSLIDQNAVDTTTLDMYHTYFNSGNLKGYAWAGSVAAAQDNGWVFRGCNGVSGNDISCAGRVLFYAPLEQGPGNPNTTYYASDRLYRSDDKGLTHTLVSQSPIDSSAASAIGISPQNDAVRIVGTSGGGIFGTGTTPGTTSLQNLDPNNTVPNNFIARAVVSPTVETTAYVTLSAFGVTNVWKTTNLNASPPTWTAAAGSGANVLPQVPVNAFIVDPLNPIYLYAGTDIGVYSSIDGGANWLPFGTGLPRVAVFDMAMSANRQVRIATHGRGMWQIPALAPPTAASVTIGGSVFFGKGRGISNARITLTNQSGETRYAITNSFGYYRFDDVEVGQTYIFTISHKRYSFAPQVLSVIEELTELNFTAEP